MAACAVENLSQERQAKATLRSKPRRIQLQSYVQVAPLREARDLPKDSRSSQIQHRKQSWRKLASFTLRKNFHLRVLESKIWTLLALIRYCLETVNPLILSAMHSLTRFLGVWLGLLLFMSNTLVGATEVYRKYSDPY